MKICLVTFLYEPNIGGGAAAVAQGLARELAHMGHSVSVITSGRGRRLEVDWDGEVKIVRLPPANLYWVGGKDRQPGWKKAVWQILDTWNPIVYRTVREMIKAEAPDVVHVHKLRGLSPAVWSAARSAGVQAIVHTCHDYEVISPEGQLVSRIGRLAKNGSAWLWPYQALRRHASMAVKAVTAPSNYVLQAHTSLGFFKKAAAVAIPNSHGLSSEQIRQNMAQCHFSLGSNLRLLYLGRLEREKGPEVVVKAIEDLDGVELDIAGWGGQEAELRRRYEGRKQVHFLGALTGAAKAHALEQCDALVAPSTWEENFPLVIAEAYAFGKPVLGSRIGGIPEVVENEITGWLVEPGDPAAWRKLVEGLLNHSHDLLKMAGACFSRAQDYTKERVMDLYLDLYHNMLSNA